MHSTHDPFNLEPEAQSLSATVSALDFATPKLSDIPALDRERVQDVNEVDKTNDTASVDVDSTKESGISPSSSGGSTDETHRSSQTSMTSQSIKYPPTPLRQESDAASMMSHASSSSRKARPESALIEPPIGPIVPGIALVDFNHLVGL